MYSTEVHQLFPAQLLNSMVYYVVINDMEGKCMYVNRLAQNLFAQPLQNLSDTAFSDIIWHDDITLYAAAEKSCIEFPDKHTSVAIRKK